MTMPRQFICDVVLPAMNVFLTNEELTIGEFYKWLGCHFFMACFQGINDRNDWWSTAPIDMFSGAPFRLNEFMMKHRFLEIMAGIVFTDVLSPMLDQGGFVDRFHDFRKLIDAWNDHMVSEYNPLWLNCLDESMNLWLSKFCPGFMCIPRKPHPFGNEYHTIANRDGGKPIRESRDVDIPLVARHFYHHAGWAELIEDEFPGHRPVGVCGQKIKQIGQLGNGAHLHAQRVAHILNSAVLYIFDRAIGLNFGGHFLAV